MGRSHVYETFALYLLVVGLLLPLGRVVARSGGLAGWVWVLSVVGFPLGVPLLARFGLGRDRRGHTGGILDGLSSRVTRCWPSVSWHRQVYWSGSGPRTSRAPQRPRARRGDIKSVTVSARRVGPPCFGVR